MAIRMTKAAAAKKVPAGKSAAKTAKPKPSTRKPAAQKPAPKKSAAQKKPTRAAKPAALEASALDEGKAHAVRPAEPAGSGEAASGVIHAPLSRLRENPANYRRTYDDEAIRELAASIRAEGVLQNLVTLPADEGGYYTVNSGNRRLRALELLAATGEIPADHPVPILPRAMSEGEALALAIVENLQRQDVDPLEEADGFRRLRDLGWSTGSIASSVGIKQRTVQDRLQLAEGLFPRAREALAAREITLDQARALVTAPTPELQDEMLRLATRRMMPLDSTALRQHLKRTLPAVVLAAFPLERYTGAYVGEGDERRFADAEQFHALQKARAEELVEELGKKWARVEVVRYFWAGNFRHDDNPETGGVIIELNNAGELTVHEGYARPAAQEVDEADEAARAAEAEEWARLHTQRAEGMRKLADELHEALIRQPSLAPRIVLLAALMNDEISFSALSTGSWEIPPSFVAACRATLDEPDLGRRGPEEPDEFEPIDNDTALRVWEKLVALPERVAQKLFAELTVSEFYSNYGPNGTWQTPTVFGAVSAAIAAAAGVEIPAILRHDLPEAEEPAAQEDDGEPARFEDDETDGDRSFADEDEEALA